MKINDEDKGRFKVLAQQLLAQQSKAELNDAVLGAARIFAMVALRQPEVRAQLELIAAGDFTKLDELFDNE